MPSAAESISVGADVLDEYGEPVGCIEEVIFDAQGHPIWVEVTIGTFGMLGTVVPLAGCTVDALGVHVPYARSTIEAAPYSRTDTSLDVPALSAHYSVDLPPPAQ